MTINTPCELISDLYVHSVSKRPALRLGLLIDNFQLSRAAASVVSDIVRSDIARLELVVCTTRRTEPHTLALSCGYNELRPSEVFSALLWRLYSKFDRRLKDLSRSATDRKL